MPFDVQIDHPRRTLAITYPAQVNATDALEFPPRVRQAIDELAKGGKWFCLVDQRALPTLPAHLLEILKSLNAYGQAKGMSKSARIVSDAIAGLSVLSLKTGDLKVPIQTFQSREDALQWLLTP